VTAGRAKVNVLCLAAAASDSAVDDCRDKGCSHDCETVGEFPLCVCPSDMVLDRDGRTCKDTTSFLLATFRGIKLYNEATEDEATVAPGKAGCLDYHYGRKEVYAYTNYTLMRYPLAKGRAASPVSLVARTDTAVTSLAVDWVSDVIYHISEQRQTVGVTSLDTGNTRNLVTHNDSASAGWHSLVVDPYVKKLFWVGNRGVFSSDLEGEGLTTEVISGLKPDKIALDTRNKLIYAIGRRGEKKNKYITRTAYNGTKVGADVEVRQPATVEIFGLGVVGNTVYWESNHDGENIYKCNLEESILGKGEATLVAELNQIVYDMKVYHLGVQKPPK